MVWWSVEGGDCYRRGGVGRRAPTTPREDRNASWNIEYLHLPVISNLWMLGKDLMCCYHSEGLQLDCPCATLLGSHFLCYSFGTVTVQCSQVIGAAAKLCTFVNHVSIRRHALPNVKLPTAPHSIEPSVSSSVAKRLQLLHVQNNWQQLVCTSHAYRTKTRYTWLNCYHFQM